VTLLAGLGCAWGAAAQTVNVIEFYNANLDHYFVSALQPDVDALDAGRFAGWVRTGQVFKAYPQPGGVAQPVCRFYLPPALGDSHFYSASAQECAEVAAKYPAFVLESPNVMYVDLPDPVTGACPPGDIPVYRLWNARADTNHRYTTDRANRAAMVARGWIAEGYGPDQAVLCAPSGGGKVSAAQIVFATGGVPGMGGGPQEIVTMNLDGSMRTQVTHDGTNKFLPHFSPDGTRLLYSKFLTGAYDDPRALTAVAVYDFASATESLLTHDGTSFQPAWSPEGTRIAYGTRAGDALWIMNADGSNARLLGRPSGAPDDVRWGDFAWSIDDWILFTVGQNPVTAQHPDGCFTVRLDKMRPDGTARTRVTDGGPNCTPDGKEQSGDADPGFSADGRTIYTSRGFPVPPAGGPAAMTERKLFAVSSAAFTPGKPESDLSLPTQPSCIEGVPKGSPDGTRILLFRACFDAMPVNGIFVTDTAGSYRTRVTEGFGADWNPVAK
jgi:hypothetical protein